ncbi:MAG: lycopene cyclase domain-containing protein [Candidatus Omnitrophica bacterium]|jgi:lycopene cyclase domain-containing protein|nr:lycopene cyclase domain-containing protein [Candidatus Omnitrophota bacterium]MDD3987698.1 lycopene cyclase domain-containing protein [Candidatus Omnitrophota bacterium]MDD4981880.1 lycopene cyclase domain-containing protein [Candidatus Omnitrophota bacterium]MDD5665115.1 lycopene cyclase domain-containing protein [Candidatus Omnitrophota bacterium]
MKEYTILALFSVLAVFILDALLKTRVLKRKIFWLFIFIIAIFKLLVNGYLTATKIVNYNPEFFLGIKLGSIPLEDFLFGFSMVSIAIIIWEYFGDRKPC